MSSVAILIKLSVVTIGNNKIIPTISPFGISDKTLMNQNICFMYIYILNIIPLSTIYISLPLSCYAVTFPFITLYLIIFFYISVSLPLFVKNAKVLYICGIYTVIPKWDRKSLCTLIMMAKVLSQFSCKIWQVERAN